MQNYNNKINGLKIAYIGGGSKNWAWTLMRELAMEEDLSGTVKLYDIDFQSACENCEVGNNLSKRSDTKGKWNYEVVSTLQEALVGADFIIVSILPGTFEEMYSDVHTPEKYGIYQSVGDTVGPAGLMRALRTIPIYAEFAESIKKYAPDAWLINYTNPMTLCTRALYAVFPEIKAFGCCHGVFESQHFLAHVLKEMMELEEVDRKEIKINVLGINHFTWIDKAFYKNIDIMPLYKEFSKKYAETGYECGGSWERSVFSHAAKVRMNLSQIYGIMPAISDRHLVEFLPPWFLKDPETVKSWKFHLTSVDYRKEESKKREEYRKRVLSGEEQIVLKPTGEESVLQMKALLGLGDMVTNVNIPNYGQMEGIPLNCVVETNAHISRIGVNPVFAGKLPDEVQNLVMHHVLNQETILKAALAKDKEIAFRAFVNDPLVNISLKDARKLFIEMLENTKKYLPGWNI